MEEAHDGLQPELIRHVSQHDLVAPIVELTACHVNHLSSEHAGGVGREGGVAVILPTRLSLMYTSALPFSPLAESTSNVVLPLSRLAVLKSGRGTTAPDVVGGIVLWLSPTIWTKSHTTAIFHLPHPHNLDADPLLNRLCLQLPSATCHDPLIGGAGETPAPPSACASRRPRRPFEGRFTRRRSPAKHLAWFSKPEGVACIDVAQ